MKEGQYSQPPGPGPGSPGSPGSPGQPETGLSNAPQREISPGQSFQLGRKAPLFWGMQRIIDATLPFAEWSRKNPGKTHWDYRQERKKLFSGQYSWIQKAMMPVQLRQLLNRSRRF